MIIYCTSYLIALISIPALFLFSTKNHDLWEVQQEVHNSRTSHHSANTQSQVWQIWLAESTKQILSTCSVKNGHNSSCWPKGAWPLGTRMMKCIETKWLMRPECIPVSVAWEWLRVFLFPPWWNAGPSQGYPPALHSPVPIYTLGWREALWE